METGSSLALRRARRGASAERMKAITSCHDGRVMGQNRAWWCRCGVGMEV